MEKILRNLIRWILPWSRYQSFFRVRDFTRKDKKFLGNAGVRTTEQSACQPLFAVISPVGMFGESAHDYISYATIYVTRS